MRFVGLFVCLSVVACGGGDDDDSEVTDGGAPDAIEICNPLGDDDNDGISNATEACETSPARDTDMDGVPDWKDGDSDNDGVDDRYEDRNGDGVIGMCTMMCGDPPACPAEQVCTSGFCVNWVCADGETDPLTPDTDQDGVRDGNEGTFICNPPTEDDPNGLKPFRSADSVDIITNAQPNWKVAVETFAAENLVQIAAPNQFESAYYMDLTAPETEVAGFVVSRAAAAGDTDAVTAKERAIQAIDFSSGIGAVTIRAGGTRETSLDGEDTILGTTLIVTVSAQDAPSVREKVVQALLARPAGDLTFPNVGWTGMNAGEYAVVFQTLYRAADGQVLFAGGVARRAAFDDPTRSTGFNVDDMANGTALTVSGNGTTIECDPFMVSQVPKADLMWVIDESGSMDDDRMRVANSATALFNKAVTNGLDFRMGVTDMSQANLGRFASRTAATSDDDRWLLPDELAAFQNTVNDPSGPALAQAGFEHGLTQGRAALNRHLPRDDADPQKVRSDATLVVIYVTDEAPDELEDAGYITDGGDTPSPAELAMISLFMQSYIVDFLGNDAVAHVIAVPESQPNCSSLGEAAWGYYDLVASLGGQFGSICQNDLGPTLDAIIDDIVGAASPITLQWRPISLTIAVSRDGVAIPRSRSNGWDYRAGSNSIIFNNMPFDPDDPAEVVVSYQRWSAQVPVE